ncbi:class I SAM-dependent methyltransferase [Inquilinus sp. CA228]|uniref:class I SAM-dependent methyltransferase n=1 Tax=Inquilinus sp. CA228 TaxID=3455609 RepID=UPI003F8D62F2
MEKSERYGDRLFHPGREGEYDRLTALAAAFDPATQGRLAALGVRRGWRCLDVGAGPGTVSRWLAEVVAGGEVVAVDRDTRFLEQIDHPRLAVMTADITEPDFAPGTFDLVHARFVLMHLRDRDHLLARMLSWVRPGGWLVVSDHADFGVFSSAHSAYRNTLTALWRTLANTIGTDMTYGRRHPGTLAAHRLTDIGMAVDLPIVTAGSPLALFWDLTLRQAVPSLLASGSVAHKTIESALAYLADPGICDLSVGMITAWGRRPSSIAVR